MCRIVDRENIRTSTDLLRREPPPAARRDPIIDTVSGAQRRSTHHEHRNVRMLDERPGNATEHELA